MSHGAIEHISAGGVVISQGKEIRVALLLDSDGNWVLPKGHMVSESLLETSRREIREELGIKGILEPISLLGFTSYNFQQNSRLNQKTVHWYLYFCRREVVLLPQKEEGFIAAEWQPLDKALSIISYPLEKAIIKKATVIAVINKFLGNNFLGLILSGSNSGFEKQHDCEWGDVDLLVVVNRSDYKAKKSLRLAYMSITKLLRVRIGLRVARRDQILKISNHIAGVGGKTLQTLYDLSKDNTRLIYSIGFKAENCFRPTKKLLTQQSFADFGQVLSDYRRAQSTLEPGNLPKAKAILEKSINLAFLISKLALQYQGVDIPKGKRDLSKQVKKYFPGIDSSSLIVATEVMGNWCELNSLRTTIVLSEKLDDYIEGFSEMFIRSSNKNFTG